MKKLLTSIAALAATFTFHSCNPAPAVNPDGSVVAPEQVSPHLLKLGASEFTKYKKKNKISTNSRYKAQLNRVAKRVSKVVNMPGARWEFVVFDNKVPNAFALPGGKIGVHSGLFQITQNDAGLAAVVGHEIAHVTLNHASDRQRNAAIAMIGGILLDQAVRKNGGNRNERKKAGALYGTAATLGAVLPFSRKQEYQADRVGAVYMAQAGYNPREAIRVWKRFKAFKDRSSKGRTPEFLSTHPVDTNRINALNAFMPTALKSYKK